jgi:hypothetical protein
VLGRKNYEQKELEQCEEEIEKQGVGRRAPGPPLEVFDEFLRAQR